MINKKIIYLSGFTLIVVLIDILTRPSLNLNIMFDFIILSICGIIGLKLVTTLGLPIFYSRKIKSKTNYVVLFVSLLVVVLNTFPWLMNLNKITQKVNWFTITKPSEAILLALRAGITEEIIFRFFLFSMIIWLLQKITAHFNLENKNEKITIFSAVIASIIFTALHSFNILAFVLGLMLTFIYFKKGIIPVMIVHFLADAIPFLLVVINLS